MARQLKALCAVLGVCLTTGLIADNLSQKELLSRIKSAETYTPGTDRIINVAEFGAFGDNAHRPLGKIFDSQDKIDAFYGKGLYVLNDELDYVAFCEALRAARMLSNPVKVGPLNIMSVMPQIYLPNGKYHFNRTVKLTKMMHCTIRGAGRQSTQIFYYGKEDLFLIQDSAFIWIKDMSFFSSINKKSTIFHINDPCPPVTGMPTFKFSFENLEFSSCYRCFYVTGIQMTDGATLINNRFQGCLIGLHLNNWMCYNWNLYNCEFESRPDNIAAFSPYKPSDTTYVLVDSGGSAMNFYGGGIIHGGKTLYIKSSTSTMGDNWSRSFYNFWGTKWEQHGTDPCMFDGEGDIYCNINFSGCSSYQSQSVAREMLKSKAKHPGINGRLMNGMNVTIDNCQFTHGEFVGEINERTRANFGNLVVRNSRVFTYREHYSDDSRKAEFGRHNVSYQPNSGYKENDAIIYKKLYDLAKLPKQVYPDISPSGYMAFDIPANETVAVGVKRVVKKLLLKSDKTLYSQSFPKVCTLSKIIFLCENKKDVTVTITRGPDKLKGSVIRLTPEKHNVHINDIETESNTPGWDGVLEFSLDTKEKTADVKIVCEYF